MIATARSPVSIAALTILTVAACERSRAEPPPAERSMSSEDYDRWRRPDDLVRALQLAPGAVVADLGAGSGYLTGRLARAVGPRGRVVATEIDPALVAALAHLPADPEMAPIEARQVAADHHGLEATRYDLVLMAQVDHLLTDRQGYLRSLRSALSPGGRLAVSNRLQHRGPLFAAAAGAGYDVIEERSDLPGQFVVLLSPRAEEAP